MSSGVGKERGRNGNTGKLLAIYRRGCMKAINFSNCLEMDGYDCTEIDEYERMKSMDMNG